jgi:maltose alpha-D-glucosyltransferase/alpha-amylase
MHARSIEPSERCVGWVLRLYFAAQILLWWLFLGRKVKAFVRDRLETMEVKWWKNAVIYAVDVEFFCDGNGDGVGDFKGLTSKLPYLSDLGITALWVLPFYVSNERDNGYDVTDYFQIHPKYGTLADFLNFVHKAGESGIRIIMDLVVDHTSNKHPWFEASRYNKSSRYRNYYYWSDHPPIEKPGLGTLFPGEEQGVWTYDEIAGAFYHHRFYHFEPSLNIHNADVRDEIKRIIDYWMTFGISGFRIDAAGRMAEYPGHEVKEPEDTHQPLRDIFSHTKALDKDAILIGEADTTPQEVTLFMDGTQIDMCFNFFLNNHIFLSLATREAEPIIRSFDLLRSKLKNEASVNFLRNLDELDFSQVTDAERQTIFDAFAPKKEMVIYGRGIRRRLAPILNGDIERIKMAYSLLFSLPGTPKIVYGDEIGMGDDPSQPGRNNVRTPMQWSGERNAGFSDAAKSKLIRPVIEEGRFDFHRVNVEAQRGVKDSLLEHIRTLARLRRQMPVMGESDFQSLPVKNPSVLVHWYKDTHYFLIHIHNFKNTPARIKISLDFAGETELYDLLGEFQCKVHRKKVKVSVGGYGCLWLSTQRPGVGGVV